MKRRKPSKPLTMEDRTLWKQVAQSVTPLSEKRGRFLKDEMAKLMGEAVPSYSTPDFPSKKRRFDLTPLPLKPKAPSKDLHTHPIEERIVKNLAKGRQHIDSRIDLHGMTQDRARFALLDYLQMAQRSGERIVLVITGKGNEGQGVLKTNVPLWLSLPQFKTLVNGFRASHSSHGGEGALYVRLRRSPTSQSHDRRTS